MSRIPKPSNLNSQDSTKGEKWEPRIIIGGAEYYQPECHCEPGMGHICYLRPVPTIIDIPIEKIIKSITSRPVNDV